MTTASDERLRKKAEKAEAEAQKAALVASRQDEWINRYIRGRGPSTEYLILCGNGHEGEFRVHVDDLPDGQVWLCPACQAAEKAS